MQQRIPLRILPRQLEAVHAADSVEAIEAVSGEGGRTVDPSRHLALAGEGGKLQNIAVLSF